MTGCNDLPSPVTLGQWLQEHCHEELGAETWALLLALASLDSETNPSVAPDILAKLEPLAEQYPELDTAAIKEAVHALVHQPADPARQVSWRELKRRNQS